MHDVPNLMARPLALAACKRQQHLLLSRMSSHRPHPLITRGSPTLCVIEILVVIWDLVRGTCWDSRDTGPASCLCLCFLVCVQLNPSTVWDTGAASLIFEGFINQISRCCFSGKVAQSPSPWIVLYCPLSPTGQHDHSIWSASRRPQEALPRFLIVAFIHRIRVLFNLFVINTAVELSYTPVARSSRHQPPSRCRPSCRRAMTSAVPFCPIQAPVWVRAAQLSAQRPRWRARV